MPEMDGLEAKAMQGDREECLAAGMDGYIAKPVRMEELGAALARATRPHRRAEPDQPPARPPSSIRTS